MGRHRSCGGRSLAFHMNGRRVGDFRCFARRDAERLPEGVAARNDTRLWRCGRCWWVRAAAAVVAAAVAFLDAVDSDDCLEKERRRQKADAVLMKGREKEREESRCTHGSGRFRAPRRGRRQRTRGAGRCRGRARSRRQAWHGAHCRAPRACRPATSSASSASGACTAQQSGGVPSRRRHLCPFSHTLSDRRAHKKREEEISEMKGKDEKKKPASLDAWVRARQKTKRGRRKKRGENGEEGCGGP